MTMVQCRHETVFRFKGYEVITGMLFFDNVDSQPGLHPGYHQRAFHWITMYAPYAGHR